MQYKQEVNLEKHLENRGDVQLAIPEFSNSTTQKLYTAGKHSPRDLGENCESFTIGFGINFIIIFPFKINRRS